MELLVVVALAGALFFVPTAYAGLIGAPWAPTRRAAIQKAFDGIGIGAADTVVDLGAGDGVILLQATARGAHAIGYELSPIMWIIGHMRAARDANIQIKYGNFFRAALPQETTLVFFFLMPKHMNTVGKYLAAQQLAPKTLILSYAFSFRNITPSRIYREKKCAPLYVYELSKVREHFDNSRMNP